MPAVSGAVNPSTSQTVDLSLTGTVINTWNSISSLASATETVVVDYTVPATKKFLLKKIEASGENVAVYNVYIDSAQQARRRTYWGGPFDTVLDFSGDLDTGLEVAAGDKIELKVIHARSETGDFDGRILGVLDDA